MSHLETDVKDLLMKIVKIWDELGIDPAYRKNQCDIASSQVINIYNDLFNKELKYKDDILKDILNGLESLCAMATELGETVNKDNNQIMSSMNLLQRSQFIEEELGKYRKRIQDRMIIIEDLEYQIEETSKEMELSQELNDTTNIMMTDESKLNGNDYSLEKISSLQKKFKILKEERNESFIKIKNLTHEIVELWEELRISPETEFEKSILTMTQSTIENQSPISLSLATLTVLDQKKNKLKLIRSEHESMVCEYAKKITDLWDKLDVPEDERESFFSKTSGLGYDVIEACQEELQRVEDLRKSTLSEVIQKTLFKIQEIYSQLHLPLDKLYEISNNTSNCKEDSEELLELYQSEYDRVYKLLEISKPILQLIESRETIRNNKIEYEQTIMCDKERLLSKKFDRVKAAQEEKLRASFQKLPTIEEKLKKSLISWQNNHGFPFCFEGFNYLELIHQQAEQDKKFRESEKARKEREKQQKAAEENRLKNGFLPNIGGGKISSSSSSSSLSINNSNGPKTPTSSRILKSVNTPSTPKTPTSKIFSSKQQDHQSPFPDKKVTTVKKRNPLSPLNSNSSTSPRPVKPLNNNNNNIQQQNSVDDSRKKKLGGLNNGIHPSTTNNKKFSNGVNNSNNLFNNNNNPNNKSNEISIINLHQFDHDDMIMNEENSTIY
eukprot:gene3117-3898_t